MKNTRIDETKLVNRKFELLTVIRVFIHEKWQRTYCECKCDCGQSKTMPATFLLNGRQTSCGCKRRGTGKDSHAWSGVGDIAGSEWHRITQHVERRKIPIEITLQDAWDLFLKQGGRCALSGASLKFAPNKKKFLERTASLDRIDSKKGYIKGNVQWVHKVVNMMKQGYDQKDFLLWCGKIVDFQKPIC